MWQGVSRWMILGGLVAVAAVWLLWPPGQEAGPEGPQALSPLVSRASLEADGNPDSGALATVDAQAAVVGQGEPPSAPELPMESIAEGLDVDGAIRLDRNGNLVLDLHLRRFLDFFIGLTKGPEDEDALKQRIEALMIQEGVPGEVRGQVQKILEDYLNYREAAEQLASQGEGDLEQAFERLYSLRRDWLGPDVADGFFARDEARVQRTLDRRRILADENLTGPERERALAQLEQSLPASTRERLQQSRRLNEVSQQVAQMRKQGASEEAVRQLRARELGPEAAERLAGLDERRQQWQQKFSSYQARREKIENTLGLSPEDRQQAIETLQQEHFDTDYELRRARALERAREAQTGH